MPSLASLIRENVELRNLLDGLVELREFFRSSETRSEIYAAIAPNLTETIRQNGYEETRKAVFASMASEYLKGATKRFPSGYSAYSRRKYFECARAEINAMLEWIFERCKREAAKT